MSRIWNQPIKFFVLGFQCTSMPKYVLRYMVIFNSTIMFMSGISDIVVSSTLPISGMYGIWDIYDGYFFICTGLYVFGLEQGHIHGYQ